MARLPYRLQVIGLTGPAGAGKDTVAELLQTHRGYSAIAFADALRAEICAAYMLDPVYLTARSTKEMPIRALALDRCLDAAFVQRMGEVHESLRQPLVLAAPQSPRTIMRWWGTEYRRATQAHYWVQQVDRRMVALHAERTGHRFVLSDVRFRNEAALVRKYGGQIWRIRRPGHEARAGEHVSEVTGSEFAPDVVIDNVHDIGHLQQQVLAVVGEGAAA